MTTERALVEFFQAKCERFGHAYDFPTVYDAPYDLGISPKFEIALFVFSDPVHDEMRQLVRQIIKRRQTVDIDTSTCFDNVLGYACDPAPSGLRYNFRGYAQCPTCGSEPKSYGPYSPAKTECVELPVVTHREWDKLTAKDKQGLIVKALQDVGCLPEEGQRGTEK